MYLNFEFFIMRTSLYSCHITKCWNIIYNIIHKYLLWYYDLWYRATEVYKENHKIRENIL